MINYSQKGKRFERQVANLFKPYFPNAKRGLQYQADEYVPDVVNTRFYIECKSGKEFISINYGKKKTARYDPDNPKHMEKIFKYYYDRMYKWNLVADATRREREVIIIWKMDYKGIRVTIREDGNLATFKWSDFEAIYLKNSWKQQDTS